MSISDLEYGYHRNLTRSFVRRCDKAARQSVRKSANIMGSQSEGFRTTSSAMPAIATTVLPTAGADCARYCYSLRAIEVARKGSNPSPPLLFYFASQTVRRWFSSSYLSLQKAPSLSSAFCIWAGVVGRYGSIAGSASAIASLFVGP